MACDGGRQFSIAMLEISTLNILLLLDFKSHYLLHIMNAKRVNDSRGEKNERVQEEKKICGT